MSSLLSALKSSTLPALLLSPGGAALDVEPVRGADRLALVTALGSLVGVCCAPLLAGEPPLAKKADKLAKDFRVSDAQYAYLRVRALSQLRDWAGLWSMANEKRSPIGYRPFAEAAMLGGSNVEAKRYVMSKMQAGEYSERMELLANMGSTGLLEMIELAKQQKDEERLQDLAQQCVTPATREACEKALAAVSR